MFHLARLPRVFHLARLSCVACELSRLARLAQVFRERQVWWQGTWQVWQGRGVAGQACAWAGVWQGRGVAGNGCGWAEVWQGRCGRAGVWQGRGVAGHGRCDCAYQYCSSARTVEPTVCA
eukprot:365650-Chlamydomonas_euryale.AAC.7